MTPTKISLCSLWHNVMISGYNTLTIYVADFGEDTPYPQPHISPHHFNELIRNGKPCLTSIVVNSTIKVSTILTSINSSLIPDFYPEHLAGLVVAPYYISVHVEDGVVVARSASIVG